MIIKYSQVIGSPVVTLDDQKNLGQVFDIVLNKSDLSIKAVLVKNNSILPFSKVITFSDLVEVTNNALIVQNQQALISKNASVRVKQSIREKCLGVGQRVITKSGKKIGKVFDYIFENSTGQIGKLYVKSLLSERIISVASVISYDRKTIRVEDDFELIKDSKTAFEAEVA